MADTPSPLETASTRALLARLLDEAAPVRRLRTPVARLGLWLIVVATIAGAVIGLGLMGVRSDLRVKLRDPVYLLEITALTVAGMLMAAGAFQEAVPGYQARWPIRRVALGFGLLAALLWFLQPRHGELAVTQFIGTGIGCASRTVVLAALPLCALLIAVRRGAPLAPARAGALAGGAAFLTAALLMRIDCPLDERLHLLVWHALPVAGGAGLSAVIGFVWLRRWRVRATR
ncbi:MAG: hypothetical protein AUI49_03415 [Candidatus Rokubacteria bacterium 13_1_40CM_2_68_13]|nr:MAG: hypothetical protein AUI49_03415 [Candidatus Rokubacteria bacterium 13_1_40CM_2_68_13]